VTRIEEGFWCAVDLLSTIVIVVSFIIVFA
jgi:hypothetical protein